jgi:hypothetical protein
MNLSKLGLSAVAIAFALLSAAPAISQQRAGNAPMVGTSKPMAPARGSDTLQNQNFNAQQQQKLKDSAKERTLTATTEEGKKINTGLKAKKEDQLSKSATEQNKKLNMKQRMCSEQCAQTTGYTPASSKTAAAGQSKSSGGGIGGSFIHTPDTNPGDKVGGSLVSAAKYSACMKNCTSH